MYFLQRFLIGCLLLCVCHAAPYVPGEPGGSWTESDLSVVKAKLYAVYSRSDDVMNELYEGTDVDTDGGEPSAPKMIRLGFHDCLRLELSSVFSLFCKSIEITNIYLKVQRWLWWM